VRIVSLCPSTTESLVALGLGDRIVGVTRYCVRPREVTARIPRVGGTKDPDLAAIRALRPDLVFANAEENRREDVEALASDLAVDVSHPRRAADVPPLLRRLGRLTGTEGRAEEIASRVEEDLERAERRGGHSSLAPFRYVYLVWKDPLMTAGPRTYIADLLRIAGGVPSLAPEGGRGADYPPTDEGSILAARPDVLILPDEPFRFREADEAYWRGRLPATDVRPVAGDDWCWHGVGTLRGLAAAASLSAAVRAEA
jgi:ABC-type Fe3+-hydroxamate transport system substrate-binding protein